MPIYDYQCKGCGHEFEKEQRISEKPVKKCPSCGAMKAKRLISKTSFLLKGGGWYNDLYASGGKSKPEGKTDGDGAGAGDSESTSKDTTDKGTSKSDDKGKGKTASKSKGGKGKGSKAAA